MAITTIPGASASDQTTLLGTELVDSFSIDQSKLYVDALEGADTVTAAGAIDSVSIDAGADNDTITFSGEALKSTIKVGKGNDSVSLQDFSGTVYGSSGQDTITHGSNRTVTGGLLRGDEGNDSFTLVNANGVIINTNSDDDQITISGTSTNSSIYGGRQRDTISIAKASGGLVRGDANEDEITISNEITDLIVNGNADADTIDFTSSTAAKTSTIFGGAGKDSITVSGAGGLVINGNKGDDDIDITASGVNTIDGGAGDDNIEYTVGSVAIGRELSVNGGDGDDTILLNEKAVDKDGADSVHTVNGGAGDDDITGTAGKEVIDGEDGDDTIVSSGGNDTIYGKGGDDTITAAVAGDVNVAAGQGDDTINIDTATLNHLDTIKGELGTDKLIATTFDDAFDMTSLNSVESKAFDNISGIETFGAKFKLTASSTFTLSSAAQSAGIVTIDNSEATGDANAADVLTVDASEFTSSVNLNMIGSDSDAIRDSLIGGSGNDTLSTGEESDGTDGDVLFGGAGTDKFVVAAASGLTEILDLNTGESFTVASTTNDLDVTVKSDFTASSATVNNKALVGGAYKVLLDADDGVDINMASASGGFGYKIEGGATAVSLTGSAYNDSIVGGNGKDQINGGNGADDLTGGAEEDTISGGEGNDTITGGLGADSITLGNGTDVVVATSQATTDTVTGFTIGASGDVLHIDISAINAELVTAGGNDNALVAATGTSGAAANVATGALTLSSAFGAASTARADLTEGDEILLINAATAAAAADIIDGTTGTGYKFAGAGALHAGDGVLVAFIDAQDDLNVGVLEADTISTADITGATVRVTQTFTGTYTLAGLNTANFLAV